MVIFLFPAQPCATIIPSVAVPLSLVGTFGVMYLLGYSLNNLTLMALTISTGFVVDDAIVMIENITRYLEDGDSPLEAALKGSEQIGFTIVSLTVSLIAVLIPLLFMGDVVGRLFREFAITLSGYDSCLRSRVTDADTDDVREDPAPQRSIETGLASIAATEGIFERVIAFYGRTLQVVLRFQLHYIDGRPWARWSSPFCSTSWFPKDSSRCKIRALLLGISEAPQTVSFTEMGRRQQALTRVILQDPDVESLSSFIGVDGVNTTMNSGRIQINLKPLAERKIRRRARSSSDCSPSWPRWMASRCICRRCRT